MNKKLLKYQPNPKFYNFKNSMFYTPKIPDLELNNSNPFWEDPTNINSTITLQNKYERFLYTCFLTNLNQKEPMDLHHVIPVFELKKMFKNTNNKIYLELIKSDWNLIFLTLQQHYFAHLYRFEVFQKPEDWRATHLIKARIIAADLSNEFEIVPDLDFPINMEKLTFHYSNRQNLNGFKPMKKNTNFIKKTKFHFNTELFYLDNENIFLNSTHFHFNSELMLPKKVTNSVNSQKNNLSSYKKILKIKKKIKNKKTE